MPEALTPEEIQRHIETVNHSQDRRNAFTAAIALARSEDGEALIALARVLRTQEFLDRLDPPKGEDQSIANISRIFRALAQHPTKATGRLCELIYGVAEFRDLPARINLLLGALAAVRPVSEDGANIFRASSAEGFAEVNGPLLLKNESPLALQVFEEIITGEWVESYVKVDILHRAVLPVRTRLPIIEMCGRLLDRPLPPDVRAALIETLFDYQSRLWFGPAMYPPMPQPWDSADTAALESLIALADRLLSGELETRQRAAVQSTRDELEGIVRSRRP